MTSSMKSIYTSIVPQIWIFSIIMYLGRSIAGPLKYAFIISFGILILSHIWINYKTIRFQDIVKYIRITKEYQVLGLLVAVGLLLSSQFEMLAIKGIINFLVISVLLFIYFQIKNQIAYVRLMKGWIFLTLIIGIIGLLKWSSILLELNVRWFVSTYQYGTSLVSDYNFYACSFILSTVIYFFAIYDGAIQKKSITNLSILLVFLSNVLLAGSRRGIIVISVLFLAGLFLLFRNRRERQSIFYKNLLQLYIILGSLIFLIAVLVPFRSAIISGQSAKTKIVRTIYRYSTIFSPNIEYRQLYDVVWPDYDKIKYDKTDWASIANNTICQDIKGDYWLPYEIKDNPTNLLYNGDFEHGLLFWGIRSQDSITHELVKTEYGNSVRVSRHEGKGGWPLLYKGRDIVYHKDVTYTFKFKYRILKGGNIPFKIGWRVQEGGKYQHNIPHKTEPLENGWYEYTAWYRFQESHQNLLTFMNAQLDKTVIEFADIELTCDDKLNRPMFWDQTIHLAGMNLFYNSNFEHGLEFWKEKVPNSVHHEIIKTKYGNAIRVSKKEEKGYWPLIYQGREIYYYKNLTYYIRFKYRVVQGEEVPFNVGWWLPKENPNPYKLRKDVFPIKGGWNECIASYTFNNDYFGEIETFLYDLQSNTTVDFTDIELICSDPLNRPMYMDEKPDLIEALKEERKDQQPDYGDKVLMYKRIDRWKYAQELWTKEYSWTQKLFGGGFDYLWSFGRKFYPEEDRIDYPHNPIISAFLYSGIIGGIYYVYFLILSFWYYWKYRKQHSLLFIMYVITFIFVFISSDSHFNVPIFAMLSLVPFLTKQSVKQKAQKNPA